MRHNLIIGALVAIALHVAIGCPAPSTVCTSQSCPIPQVCDGATGKCVAPIPAEGEGEGASSGEGEGEGSGANCGDDHFVASYDDVFVLGRARGSTQFQAIAPVLNPSDFGATFDQANRPTIALDGSVIVREGSGATLGFYKFVPHAHTANGPDPSDCNFDSNIDRSDDVLLPTRMCTGANTPFLLTTKGGSSTDYVYQCLNDPNVYDGATDSVVFTVLNTHVPRALTADGTFFVDDAQNSASVVDANGQETTLALTEPFTIYIVREHAGEFLVAVEDKSGANPVINAPYTLYHVSTSGTLTSAGDYNGFIGDHVFSSAMDATGAIYLADIGGKISKYTVTDPPVVVYDPADFPDVSNPDVLFSGGTRAGF